MVRSTRRPTPSPSTPSPYANAGAFGITKGPDGNLWYADRVNGSIGVVTLNQSSSTPVGLSLNKIGSGDTLPVSSKGLASSTTTRTPDPLVVPLVLDSPDLWDGLRFQNRPRRV